MNNKVGIPNELKGNWANITLSIDRLQASPGAKFLDRDTNMVSHWARLHSEIPELLDKKLKVLDVGSGNGATLEILRWYGHDAIGMDYTNGYAKGDWLYKPLIESQKLKCINHNALALPYPFKDKEFDLLICYCPSFFTSPWNINILNEFTRITKTCILLGVNVGDAYDKEKENLSKWKHDKFKMEWNKNSIYKWVAK